MTLVATLFVIALLFLIRGTAFHDAIVKALLLVGTAIAVSTHILSHFNALTCGNVNLFWSLFLLCALVFLYRQRKALRPALANLKKRLQPSPIRIWSAVVLGCAFLTALFSGINNWDSLTYHLPRVFYWIQQHSVAFFPTDNIRQNILAPFAEYAILHLWLLTGGDFYAPMVQFFAFTGCGLAVSSLAERFGGRRAGKIACLLAWSIPMAVLQSSSTQNDLVAAFFSLSAVLFLIRGLEDGTRTDFIWSGLAFGLGCLTKSTVLVWLLPTICVLFLHCCLFQRQHLRRFARFFTIAAACVAVLYGPFLLKTHHEYYGNPLGPREETARYANAEISIVNTLRNIVRNTAIQFKAPFNSLNRLEEKALRAVSPLDLDDRSSIFSTNVFEFSRSGYLTSDMVPNTIHTGLFLLVLAFCLRHPRAIAFRSVQFAYATALIVSYVGFCAYLRWQPFHSRLLMQWLLLGVPWIAAEISRRANAFPKHALLVGAVLFAVVPFCCFRFSQERPLFGSHSVLFHDKSEQMFTVFVNEAETQRKIEACLGQIQADVPQANSYGIILGGEAWEYPLIKAISASCDGSGMPCTVHRLPGNASRWPVMPDVILVRNTAFPPLVRKSASYDSFCIADNVEFFVKTPMQGHFPFKTSR